MLSLTRYAIASTLLLVLCSAGFLLRAQSQTKTPKKGSVAGKVTLKSKPAPGIAVGLRTSQPTGPFEPSFMAKTDEEGKYRLNDIPAGSYQVAPAAPAFVFSDINNSRGQTVVLGEGENVDQFDFALVRGGVITGKVTDADGRPVVEQQVSLLMADPPPNQRGPVYALSSVPTDDRGIYRMFGLASGRYKVAAGQGDDDFFMTSSGRPSYKQTFYPDVSDAARATVIEVTEGSEASKIDITLGRAAQTFTATGRVVDGENGQPIAGARFGLQLTPDEGRRSFGGPGATSNSQGEFRLENLTPGKYAIFLLPQQDSDQRSEPVAFEILDQDVSGLVVRTSKGAASLAGTVVLENSDDEAVFARLMQLRIQGYVQNSNQSPVMGHTATITPDGSFLLKGLEPGSAYISLVSGDRSLMKGFTVSRTERDGIVQARGIEVKNGDQITGLRLVVSYGNAIVHGVVKLENGTLPAGARIFVQVAREGEARSNIRPPQVDSRGHFMMEGLPGGLYNFEANVYVPGASGRPRPPVKQQVNVQDGVVNEVTITVDLNPNPGPPSP